MRCPAVNLYRFYLPGTGAQPAFSHKAD